MADNQLQNDLLKMRREAEERDAQRRAEQEGVGYLPVEKASVNVDALAILDEHSARVGHCAIIASRDRKIACVAYDIKYSKTKQVLEQLQGRGYAITTYVVSLSTLEYVLGYYRFIAQARNAISGSVSVGEGDEEDSIDPSKIATLQDVQKEVVFCGKEGRTSRLMQVILLGAVANRASDIHIEPQAETVKLRYRIDGMLHDVCTEIPHTLHHTIVSRVKLLSNLKINIRDEAQDGRFTIAFPNKKDNIEVRVAIAPSEFGEVVVMRILDPDAIALSLHELGIREDDLAIIETQLERPNGMILNTGPTGSGKTTTLYAFLKKQLSPHVKIITIEDPIEYHVQGIEQTQVDDEAGYTFANGLRSLMRQDPDSILVGEIRDKETAEIAVQAALTGHLVFSTVHANEAAGGVARLLDLGVKPNSLAPALNVLIAQRLVRKLCETCKTKKESIPQTNIEEFLQSLPPRVNKEKFSTPTLFESKGCEKCNGTGFKGRIGIYEILVVTPDMQQLIIEDAGQLAITKKIKEGGDFVSMQQDGVLKALEGITTLEEVADITGPIVWKEK